MAKLVYAWQDVGCGVKNDVSPDAVECVGKVHHVIIWRVSQEALSGVNRCLAATRCSDAELDWREAALQYCDGVFVNALHCQLALCVTNGNGPNAAGFLLKCSEPAAK